MNKGNEEKKLRTLFVNIHPRPSWTKNKTMIDFPLGLCYVVSETKRAGYEFDLVDLRVEPKFVTTIKRQGDTMQRSGIMVPIIVSGTFTEPKFRPDLKGMFNKGIGKELADPKKIKELLKGKTGEEGGTESIEKKAKSLLKGFLGK